MRHLREKKAKSAILSVEKDNILGIKFFKRLGFRYLEPVFSNHNRARNYVRAMALIHGYLRNLPYRIQQYTPSKRNFNSSGMTKTRIWYIMLKEFDQIRVRG